MFVRQVITLGIATGILLIGTPGLIRRRLWGELWTHTGLTLTATTLVMLSTAGVKVPPLLEWLVTAVRPWGRALLGWLG